MKFKVLVEYEYPIEHKSPVKAEIVLHGDRVVTDNIKWIEQEPFSFIDKDGEAHNFKKAIRIIRKGEESE